MNNQVSQLLDVQFPDPQHSNFNLGRVNRFTADVGYLIPCYVEEVLADSYKRLDLEALVQCNATVAPVMGSFTTKVEAYFVPIRIYHEHLINNDRAIDFSDDFAFHYFPWLNRGSASTYANGSTMVVAPGSLLEYLGMFPAGWHSGAWTSTPSSSEMRINAYPFIGYFDIYRNYYANPYDEDIPFRVYNKLDNDYNPFQDGLFGDDATIKLSVFDAFINQIRDDSTALVGGRVTPRAVDVFSYFNRYFKFLPNNLQEQVSVPLFQYQKGFASSQHYSTDSGLHYGLLRRTYKDDYFNARFSSDFVEYLRSQSRVKVSVAGSEGTFDITQLRLANRIAKYVDKLGFSDSRFGTWLKAHFGTKLNDRADIPQFLGSISSTLTFDDIISSAQTGIGDTVTSNEALGSRAGLGAGYMKNDGAFVEFKAVEPGYIICLFSIVPNVSYTQGIRKMFLKTRFADLYVPEMDAVGYQDLHKVEMTALGPNFSPDAQLGDGVRFEDFNTVVGKQPSWFEYMTSIDESHGLMTVKNKYGYWTLNRPYDPKQYQEGPGGFDGVYDATAMSFDPSTYIRPEYFNYIFAVNRVIDNFQVQMRWYDKTSQPMSKQVLPRL